MNKLYPIIIGLSIGIYILLHIIFPNSCLELFPESNNCYLFFLFDTSVHIVNPMEGNSWFGGAYHPDNNYFYSYQNIKSNSGFIFWHVILPLFAIILVYQRDKLIRM